jgi:hypothetical protein
MISSIETGRHPETSTATLSEGAARPSQSGDSLRCLNARASLLEPLILRLDARKDCGCEIQLKGRYVIYDN